MARKTKEEALATREKILDSAIDIFFENGVSASSLNDIAMHAGVTRGAVYWHFKNKRDIFNALNERLFKTFLDVVTPRLTDVHEDPLQQLCDLQIDLMRNVHTNPALKRIITVLLLKCDYSGDMKDFLKDQEMAKFKSFEVAADHLRRAQQENKLSTAFSPEVLTRAHHCFFSGILYEYLRFPAAYDFETHVVPSIKAFFGRMR